MPRYSFLNMIFDDVNFDDEQQPWSQICEDCAKKNGLEGYGSDYSLNKDGEGICGIEGCSNESTQYIDFNGNKLIKILG